MKGPHCAGIYLQAMLFCLPNTSELVKHKFWDCIQVAWSSFEGGGGGLGLSLAGGVGTVIGLVGHDHGMLFMRGPTSPHCGHVFFDFLMHLAFSLLAFCQKRKKKKLTSTADRTLPSFLDLY
jgi:hypothetical protein